MTVLPDKHFELVSLDSAALHRSRGLFKLPCRRSRYQALNLNLMMKVTGRMTGTQKWDARNENSACKDYSHVFD